ncbi:MAG: hypothetical protein QGI86_13015 [Candidatus Poribacteria bacterium]|nr:hypothetical protein [Candidatus Poribacteria bacterium]MDP6746893.1 hypothetical protein [Candidatus Poribacteria bacterium]MDP6998668.1 hypothetical protein [Candidatus Poribacteria bacterium]
MKRMQAHESRLPSIDVNGNKIANVDYGADDASWPIFPTCYCRWPSGSK